MVDIVKLRLSVEAILDKNRKPSAGRERTFEGRRKYAVTGQGSLAWILNTGNLLEKGISAYLTIG